jgi:hypothetical protein
MPWNSRTKLGLAVWLTSLSSMISRKRLTLLWESPASIISKKNVGVLEPGDTANKPAGRYVEIPFSAAIVVSSAVKVVSGPLRFRVVTVKVVIPVNRTNVRRGLVLDELMVNVLASKTMTGLVKALRVKGMVVMAGTTMRVIDIDEGKKAMMMRSDFLSEDLAVGLAQCADSGSCDRARLGNDEESKVCECMLFCVPLSSIGE